MSDVTREAGSRLIFGILTLSLLLSLPVCWRGIPRGNDLPQHYQFAASVAEALASGTPYPNWAPNENAGYGGVGLRFYPPLSHYVLAAGKLLTGDWYSASCLAFWFWLALSGVGAYLWAREWLTASPSFVAAALYLCAPYHLIQLYTAFLYAEFAASAVMPFVFLFVTRLCRNGKPLDVIGLAIAYATLTLTHLPLTVICSISLAVYALASWKREKWLRQATALSVGVGLGLLASAFQWVKVVTEMAWLRHATDAFASGDATFDYRQNFLLSFVYLSGLESDAHNLWFLDASFVMTLALTVPLAVLFWCNSAARWAWRPVLALLALALFMATPLSRPVWDNIGLLSKIQFPWRWVSLISLGLALLAAAGCEFVPRDGSTQKRRLAVLAVVGGALMGLSFGLAQIMRQAIYQPRAEFVALTSRVATTLNNDCWWPVWARKEAFSKQDKVLAGQRAVSITHWQARERVFQVAAGESTPARVALLYYPHWQVTVNGQPVALQPDADGATMVNVPAAETVVRLVFVEPPLVVWAWRIAGVTWAALFLAATILLCQANGLRARAG